MEHLAWRPRETRDLKVAKGLRERWDGRRTLATEWRDKYPELIRDVDYALTERQPRAHFHEWYAAIDYWSAGYHVLIEKYFLKKRRSDVYPIYRAIVGEAVAKEIDHAGSQPPDLLVYDPHGVREWFFAEAKSASEPFTKGQLLLFPRLEELSERPIHVIRIRIQS
ncbi:MAG TPA: hypothetical protein VIP07_10100 [Candidatus Limnocylindria bacterium]